MFFKQCGLVTEISDALENSGYEKPTEIQETIIPHILNGRDILGIAQTGTGKTAAFLLPILSLLTKGRTRARMPRCVILEPTRELAAQVLENFEVFARHTQLTAAMLIGGVSTKAQEDLIDKGVDVLIATPGRFLDHYKRGKLLLSDIQNLVIDEADRMLDMGFIPDIERICELVPFTRQTVLMSATMPADIEKIANRFLSSPYKAEVARQSSAAETITQNLIWVKEDKKRALLRELLNTEKNIENAIIFCNSKKGVSILVNSLLKHSYSTASLHGDMPQSLRLNVIEQFKQKKIKCLVASDVAARGLDVPHVSHVFNFDVPHNPEDYVHRIGRTGRAGRLGISYTFATHKDKNSIEAIEKLCQKTIMVIQLPSLQHEIESNEINDNKSFMNKHKPKKDNQNTKNKYTSDSNKQEKPKKENISINVTSKVLSDFDDAKDSFQSQGFVPNFLKKSVK
jgi:superfamily II DNA/RNA helicase